MMLITAGMKTISGRAWGVLVLTAAFGLTAAAVTARAETVRLKKGQTITAPITEQTEAYVKVEYQGLTLTFYRDEIESIAAEEPRTAPAAEPPQWQEESWPAAAEISGKLIADAARSVVVINARREKGTAALGTGFFVSADGLIATNFHVIFNAQDVQVTTRQGQTYPVDYVANYDDERDICVLKIDVVDAPALPLGDSDRLTAGDMIFTIGHPGGREYETKLGQYLGKRVVENQECLMSTLGTERGNSGGPLIDAAGRVIGIASSGDSMVETYDFAIPINEAKAFINYNALTTVAELERTVSQAYLWTYEARTALLAGDYAQAKEGFQKALKAEPDFVKALAGLGEVYGFMNKEDEAFSAWQKVKNLDPANPKAWLWLGKIYLTRGRFDEASEHLQKAVDLAPQTGAVYNDLGFAYAQRGMEEQAIAAFQKVIELEPGNATGYFNLAAAYFNKQDFERAREFAAQAERLGYQLPEAFKKQLQQAGR